MEFGQFPIIPPGRGPNAAEAEHQIMGALCKLSGPGKLAAAGCHSHGGWMDGGGGHRASRGVATGRRR